MFDIGFWELVLIAILGLIVLGPERMPQAVKAVVSWIRTIKGMAGSVRTELEREFEVQQLHKDLKEAESKGMQQLNEKLQTSVDTLKQAADSVTRPYQDKAAEKPSDTDSQKS